MNEEAVEEQNMIIVFIWQPTEFVENIRFCMKQIKLRPRIYAGEKPTF